MAEINKTLAAKLWDALTIELDRFHAKIVKHPKSIFLGYADITIGIPSIGFALKVRGVELKNLKGNPHLDFPSERGADNVFYPQVFPKTGELRAVLTTALFSDQRVLDTVEAAARVPVESDGDAPAEAMAGGDNPFA